MIKVRTIVSMLLLVAAPVVAQTQGEPAEPANALRLSLDEAVRTAAKQNLGVELQEYSYAAQGWTAKSTEGVFDLYTFGNFQTSSAEEPVATEIQAPRVDNDVFNIGVRQQLPTGAEYSLGLNNNRIEGAGRFTFLNPRYTSDFNFDFTQPLLRGFGVDVNRRNIKVAYNNLGISREQFRDVMMQTVLAVHNAYMDLIAARENVAVRNQSLFLARDQERITQIRIDVGASAPLDILQPRVAIATRDEELIIAQAQVRDAEDRLRQLMNLPPEEWDRPIVPTDDDLSVVPIDIDLDAAVAKALDLRPEMRQADLSTKSSRVDLTFAKNQVLPSLDFKVNYGLSGLAGTFQQDPTVPVGGLSGGFGDAFEQVYGFDFPAWTVGFQVGYPLRNVTARAEKKRAELTLERAAQNEKQVAQTIAVQVRQAARDIDTAVKRVNAAKAAVDAAQQNVEAEQKRFENGMTTNFNVLLVQQELSDAQSRYIQSLVSYRKAIAAYHRFVGDILIRHDIAINGELPQFEEPESRLQRFDWLQFRNYSE